MLYIINCIVLFWLGIIWTKSDWLNFFIKVIFLALSFSNAFVAAQAFGYVVKLG